MVNQVVVDGVPYFASAVEATPSIGIAVTTLNRHDVLAEALAAIEKFTPAGVPVIVVDDGSDQPVTVPPWVTLVRHEVRQGIPAGKNRCLAELMRLGVEHLFLFDDDTYPCHESWWERYAFAPEPHYQYCWTHFAHNQRPVPKMDVLYQDSGLIGYGWSMGCMLYVHADVVRDVGGMEPGFGLGFEEHAEYSQRIHNRGHTTFVHQDIVRPGVQLIYASDEHGSVTRSFDSQDRAALLERNEKLRLDRIGSTGYVEYRGHRDVVLTSYFTGTVDAQRGHHMTTKPSILAPLRDSVTDLVVLTDTDGIDGETVDAPLSAYQQRWLSEYQWLRDHPEVRYGWIVDATDTVALKPAFDGMTPGTLFSGWEPKPVDCEWIREHCPDDLKDWVDANGQQMLLNTGVVGGDRVTLMWVCRNMIDLWASHPDDPLYEMLFYNVVAYRHSNLVAGPAISTVFKANETNPYSVWKHK